jgi:hypothetical protein
MRDTRQNPGAPEAVQQFQSALRLARASELASYGILLPAEEILTPPHSTKELELLAKIVARQGRYRCAIRHWEEALRQEPGNTAFQRAKEFCERADRNQTSLHRWLRWGLGASTAVLLILLGRSCQPRSTPATPAVEPGADAQG